MYGMLLGGGQTVLLDREDYDYFQQYAWIVDWDDEIRCEHKGEHFSLCDVMAARMELNAPDLILLPRNGNPFDFRRCNLIATDGKLRYYKG